MWGVRKEWRTDRETYLNKCLWQQLHLILEGMVHMWRTLWHFSWHKEGRGIYFHRVSLGCNGIWLNVMKEMLVIAVVVRWMWCYALTYMNDVRRPDENKVQQMNRWMERVWLLMNWEETWWILTQFNLNKYSTATWEPDSSQQRWWIVNCCVFL